MAIVAGIPPPKRGCLSWRSHSNGIAFPTAVFASSVTFPALVPSMDFSWVMDFPIGEGEAPDNTSPNASRQYAIYCVP